MTVFYIVKNVQIQDMVDIHSTICDCCFSCLSNFRSLIFKFKKINQLRLYEHDIQQTLVMESLYNQKTVARAQIQVVQPTHTTSTPIPEHLFENEEGVLTSLVIFSIRQTFTLEMGKTSLTLTKEGCTIASPAPCMIQAVSKLTPNG